jgi:hypothetical protein
MIRLLSRLSRFARPRLPRWAVAAPVLPLVFLACNANDLMTPKPAPEQENDQYYEVNPIRDIDILFMIDNSPSMAKKQANLKKNFPFFMNELKKIPGGIPNVHVAVISSDLGAGTVRLANGGCPMVGGDRGVFHTNPNCGLDPNSKFLSSFNNGTMNNFQGDISQVFACIAAAGDRGCGYEHQLQATRVALYDSITPENKGFLRDEAFLAVILLTDEDDCSAPTDTKLFTDDASFPGTAASFRCAQVGHLCEGKSPPVMTFQAPLDSCTPNPGGPLIKVQDVVDSIKALKKRPDDQIIVSGIYGWPDNPGNAKYEYIKPQDGSGLDYATECQTSYGDGATPGLRIKQFVESFGSQGATYSICADDFSPAMAQIGMKLAAKLQNPCITAPLVDTKPAPGLQPDCQVIDKIPNATGGGYKEELLPICTSGKRSASGACWSLSMDGSCDASGFKIAVDRGTKSAVPGTQQAIKCLTCTGMNQDLCKH